MKNRPQRQGRLTPKRPAYRTLAGWALGVLVEQHAITECDHHGHRRSRSDPDAWNRAREAPKSLAAYAEPRCGASATGMRVKDYRFLIELGRGYHVELALGPHEAVLQG